MKGKLRLRSMRSGPYSGIKREDLRPSLAGRGNSPLAGNKKAILFANCFILGIIYICFYYFFWITALVTVMMAIGYFSIYNREIRYIQVQRKTQNAINPMREKTANYLEKLRQESELKRKEENENNQQQEQQDQLPENEEKVEQDI